MKTYSVQSVDTTLEAERIQFGLWRLMTVEKRLALSRATTRRCRQMALSGIKERNGELSSQLLKKEFVRATLGEEYLDIPQLWEVELMTEDPIWLAAKIGQILHTLSIPYFVGGSIASSTHGEPRSTQDADIAIALLEDRAEALIEVMEREFYMSEVAVADALSGRLPTFNVIHLATSIKADLYLLRPDNEYEQIQLQRRQLMSLPGDSDLTFYPCSPEDIVLQKLMWYKIAINQSEKQWRDILGVLKLQGDNRLDFVYLWH
ncbi:MAG: hypothetical protein SW833_26015 [Cyanobacteriota bacterium]|nr:hypothetical protein [Cyanobacteriota bacterium]